MFFTKAVFNLFLQQCSKCKHGKLFCIIFIYLFFFEITLSDKVVLMVMWLFCVHVDFCWMCLGDWKTHGSEYYECSRYKENPDIVNQSQQAQAREALKKYLFYFERVRNDQSIIKEALATHCWQAWSALINISFVSQPSKLFSIHLDKVCGDFF